MSKVLLVILIYLSHLTVIIVQAMHISLLQNLLFPIEKRHNDMQSHREPYTVAFQEEGMSFECCPSITHGIAPLGGLSRDGALLQLFRDSSTIQKFYETTCARGVKGRPCNFINESEWISRCEQKYTYTYAIVKDFNVTEPYRIDYMKIKSGCSCTILGPARLPVVRFTEEILDELTSELLEK